MGVSCTTCSVRSIKPKSGEETPDKAMRTTVTGFRDNSQKRPKGALISDLNSTRMFKEAVSAIVTKKKKTPEEEENILKTLSGHFIFKNLDKDSQIAILDHVKHYELGPKEIVFKQGDPGVSFFCVAKGRLEALCNGERTVIGPGTGFGELALLDGRPRTATIKTIDSCSLWGVDRKTFNSAIKRLNELSYAENKSFINSIPMFEPLSASQKELILSALVTQRWSCGQTIIKEGESGDLFYIIKEGFVVCYENKIEKRQINKGQYFGEQALLHNTVRTATVVAGSDVKVLSIGRESLMNVLGYKLEYVLYHNSLLIAIDKSPVLRSLTSSQVNSLIKCSKFQKYQPGELVISRGCMKNHKIVMVLKGSIRGPQDIGVHSCIGDREIALKDSDNYQIDYVAIVETDVAEVILAEFEYEIGGEVKQMATNNEAQLILGKVQLLRGLSNEKVKLLAQALKTGYFDDQDVIVEENTPGNSFFIIKSGQVKVYKNDTFIRNMTINDYFGERTMLFTELRTATVIASGPVECWVLHYEDFSNIISEDIRKQLVKRIDLQDTSVLLSDLTPVKSIGTGMFAYVTLAMHKTKKSLYAVKSVSRKKIASLDIYDNLLLERTILMQLDHPLIIKLIRTFKDWNRVYFLMEYVNGMDLFDVLNQLQVIREEGARFYIACMLLAVEHLHDRNIAHRDIKPENVMIDEDGYPKLIDFGTAKIITGRTYTTVGTPHYMAPELILRNGYTMSVDLWSMGIVLYEIIFGKVPFGNDEEDPKMIYESIIEHKLDLKECPYNGKAYKSFIQQLININPAARLGGGFEKLKTHPWLQNFNWNRLLSRDLKPPFVPKKTEERPGEIWNIGKSLQEYLGDIEVDEEVSRRKQSMIEPDDWDAEF